MCRHSSGSMGHSYQFTAKVEAGEISELYRAQQDGAREVAIKLFSPRASDPAYGKALIEGAKKIGALQHPSILYFEEIGFAQERLVCARAGIDGFHLGTALSRLATKEVVLPPAVAVQIMIEVLLAVGAAHAAELAHGAITPANILLARDGRVFVTDFLALWAMQRSPAMKALAARGRQAYRAPEVAKGTEPDAGSDVYSAGAVLYELLTLREVASMRGGGVSTRRDVVTPPSRLDRRVNARMDPLVLRSLEALKSRRYKNCLEMAESLRSFQGATGAAVGREEIARFVRELFPNEMGLAQGEVPWKEPFTLEAIDLNRTIPGLRIDALDRAPYSAPAPLEEAPPLNEATLQVSAFRPGDLEGATVEDPPPPSGVAEATALDIDAGALGGGAEPQVASAPEPPSFESWDAPPGQLDPAVARALSAQQQALESSPADSPGPNRRTPSKDPPIKDPPIKDPPIKDPPGKDPSGGPRPPSDTDPAPPVVDPSAAPPPPAPRPAARAKPRASGNPKVNGVPAFSAPPAARVEPAPSPTAKPDWHVVIPPPPKPPKGHTPLSWWFAAVVMALAAAGLAYLALQRRLEKLAPPHPPAAHAPSRHSSREAPAVPLDLSS